MPLTAERISRRIDSPQRGSDMDDVPSREGTPSFDSRILRRVALAQKFPPIEIDSVGGSASSRENLKVHKHDSFQCILSREPFRLDAISAELLCLEQKMLNEPDEDVRTFSKNRRKSDSDIKKTRYEEVHMHLRRNFTSEKKSEPKGLESKENIPPTANHISLPSSAHAGENRDNSDKDDVCQQDLNVSVSLANMNPVTVAVAAVCSESNTCANSSPR